MTFFFNSKAADQPQKEADKVALSIIDMIT